MRRCAVLAVVVVLVGCADDGNDPSARRAVDARYSASVSGVGIEFDMRYPEDVVATGGTVTLDGYASPPRFYRNDGDLDGASVSVPRGLTVTPGFVVRPSCGSPLTPPSIVLEARRYDASLRLDHVVLDDPGAYATAVATWCDGGVRADFSGWTKSADGRDIWIRVRIGNPGPSPATVSVGDPIVDEIRWDEAAIEVEGGEVGTLTVHGRLPADASGTARVTVVATGGDGTTRPVTVDVPLV